MAKLFNLENMIKTVQQKLRGIIMGRHVEAVISILIEELINDLFANRKIEVLNFASIFLTKIKEARHFDNRHNTYYMSPSYYRIRFQLSQQLRRQLLDNLDLEKTMKEKPPSRRKKPK